MIIFLVDTSYFCVWLWAVSYIEFPGHVVDDRLPQATVKTYKENAFDKLKLVEYEDEKSGPKT